MAISDESELTSPLMTISDESELTSPITQVLGDDLSADRRVELADVLLEMSVPLGVENATKTFIGAREGLEGSLLEKLLYDPSSNVRLIVFRKLPVMLSALMPGTEVPPAIKTGVQEQPSQCRDAPDLAACLPALTTAPSSVPPVHTPVPPVHSVRAHQSAPQGPQLARAPRLALDVALPRFHPQDARQVR
jgi:hypothetical protein